MVFFSALTCLFFSKSWISRSWRSTFIHIVFTIKKKTIKSGYFLVNIEYYNRDNQKVFTFNQIQDPTFPISHNPPSLSIHQDVLQHRELSLLLLLLHQSSHLTMIRFLQLPPFQASLPLLPSLVKTSLRYPEPSRRTSAMARTTNRTGPSQPVPAFFRQEKL